MAATIKQRLRRYNGTDYDTIHLETESELVIVKNDDDSSVTYTLGADNNGLYMEEQ